VVARKGSLVRKEDLTQTKAFTGLGKPVLVVVNAPKLGLTLKGSINLANTCRKLSSLKNSLCRYKSL
jgi:hypothetical protein